MLIFDQMKRGDPQLRAIAIFISLGMGLLLAALWYVQVVSAKRYRADLLDQSFRIVRVPAIRGKIVDRNGIPLAENRPSYNVNLYLEELRPRFRFGPTNRVLAEYRQTSPQGKPSGKVDEALQNRARYYVVSNLMSQISSLIQQPEVLEEKQFTNHYDHQRSLPFPLLRGLSAQQIARFVEKSTRVPSLALEVQAVRCYPYETCAAHLLGYLTHEDNPSDEDDISFQFRLPDFVGATGLERAFDKQLRGRPGVKSVLVNNMQYRQAEEIWKSPEPGQNVRLTIDLPIQMATEQALKRAMADPRGAAVVLDCRNGDILAMASIPTFNPNILSSHISEKDLATLLDEEMRPLINRATSGAYPPGSIFKVIVSLAGLEAGTLKTNEFFESKGYYQIDGRGHIWHDTAGKGQFDFERAFYLSSNPYFIDQGLRVGFERIADMGRRFGLGKKTGLSTRLQEAPGYFPDPTDKIKKDGSRWMAGDTVNLCIGQGEIKVTPLQMAVMTSAIANGGKVFEPRLVDEVQSQEPDSGRDATRFPPGQIRATLELDPHNLEVVRSAMLLDVEQREATGRYGTGHRAAVNGLRICGKTGTAQVMEGNTLKEHITWFISFAPFEAPRYVVVVVIEGGDSGAGTCAPVAHDIYEAILKRERGLLKIPQGSFAAN